MDESDSDGSRRIYEMTRMGSMPVIIKDMILDPQADFDDLLDFADGLNVNMAGLNTMEEMQCRLCMHLDFLEMKGNVVEKVKSFFQTFKQIVIAAIQHNIESIF